MTPVKMDNTRRKRLGTHRSCADLQMSFGTDDPEYKRPNIENPESSKPH